MAARPVPALGGEKVNQGTVRILRILAIVAIALNIAILATQIKLGDFAGGTELTKAKSFANFLVGDLQELAGTLGVAEKANVKQAMAKLHYDVYLADNQTELAGIIQNNASVTRDLIFSEYARLNAEKVLAVLNSAQEVQYADSQAVLTVEPLPAGGYAVSPANNLRETTVNALKQIENLLSRDSLRKFFQPFRLLSTFKVLIENGGAQLVPQNPEQDTIKYLEGEIENLRREYAKVNKIAGFAEISGPGVVISVYDLVFSVSGGDLRRIVGELFSAGADAITINGQRLAVNSYIVDAEEGITVDGIVLRNNPVIIQAIGDPTTLVAGVDLLFSVSFKGMLSFDIETRESLVLPAKALQ